MLLLAGLLAGCGEGKDTSDAGVDDGDGADGADGQPVLPSVCPPCVPDCENKYCGPDGCGGECGDCEELVPGSVCEFYSCSIVDEPQCGSRQCGPDPVMGSSCGTCPGDWTCRADGMCAPPTGDCTGIPEGGLCLEGFLVTCEEGAPAAVECAFGVCGLDPATQEAGCEEPPCLPGCFGRTCGDDGCGGSCGECGVGRTCRTDLGVCVPEGGCREVGEAGECQGHVLITCAAGEIEVESCLDEGWVCVDAEPGSRAGCCQPTGVERCGDLPASGQCEGPFLLECAEGSLRFMDCRFLAWGSCARESAGSYGCLGR